MSNDIKKFINIIKENETSIVNSAMEVAEFSINEHEYYKFMIYHMNNNDKNDIILQIQNKCNFQNNIVEVSLNNIEMIDWLISSLQRTKENLECYNVEDNLSHSNVITQAGKSYKPVVPYEPNTDLDNEFKVYYENENKKLR